MNVLQRPTRTGGGEGYAITGHHEIMIPLLAWAVETCLAESSERGESPGDAAEGPSSDASSLE
jgi:hypothetical protein